MGTKIGEQLPVSKKHTNQYWHKTSCWPKIPSVSICWANDWCARCADARVNVIRTGNSVHGVRGESGCRPLSTRMVALSPSHPAHSICSLVLAADTRAAASHPLSAVPITSPGIKRWKRLEGMNGLVCASLHKLFSSVVLCYVAPAPYPSPLHHKFK